MKPKYIIVHSIGEYIIDKDTVYDAQSFLEKIGLSCHSFVDDKELTEWIDTDKKAFHAGISKWGEDRNLNNCSIGVEIKIKGTHNWESFTKAIKKPESFKDQMYHILAEWLANKCNEYDIAENHILTHEMVSGVRGKVDPGEGFDLMKLRSLVRHYQLRL